MSSIVPVSAPRISTGVPGLDEVLEGGLPEHRMYLVQGDPGSGKTTMALQFLLEGVRQGEKGLYVALSESVDEIQSVATSHGWDLSDVSICDLSAADESLKAESQYTLFHPSEVELSQSTKIVLDRVEEVKPGRVVFDSLSEMRLLARDPLRYRRQILALKQFFTMKPCTVLLLDYDSSTGGGDRQLQSLTHGVIQLTQLAPEFGGERRRLRVQKVRGVKFVGGYHDFAIRTGGAIVHPRTVAAGPRSAFQADPCVSGVKRLDELMGGGLDRGTCTLIMGPAGVGKSTLAAQYAAAAADRGECSAFYVFDEAAETLITRGERLGMGIAGHIREGLITVNQVNPAEQPPGEFASRIKKAVDEDNVRIIIIDSLNGYLAAMPEERYLTAHLHELFAFLNRRGVVTILVLSEVGLVGAVESPVDLSYLADCVVLMRYFECAGEVRQAVSVVKKRTGNHARTVHEVSVGQGGISIGRELKEFQGILSGRLEIRETTDEMVANLGNRGDGSHR